MSNKILHVFGMSILDQMAKTGDLSFLFLSRTWLEERCFVLAIFIPVQGEDKILQPT